MNSSRMLTVLVFLGLANTLYTRPSWGEQTPDLNGLEDKARNAYIERFTKFTEDKNIMGTAGSPDGKRFVKGRKTKMDSDGMNILPFQSDLTYHPKVFNSVEKIGEDAKNQKSRTLFAFVSDHGKVSKAGGSSLLERTAYELHEQFSKEDDKNANKNAKQEEETGVRLRSIFKIETIQPGKAAAAANGAGGGAGAGAGGGAGAAAAQGKGGQDQPPLERVTLRDEAKTKIEEVGDGTFDTIKQAGRDQGFENDENTMPNMTFLYEAAKRATEALWVETNARLGQRRMNRGARGGQIGRTPEIDQDTPDCDAWSNKIAADLAKANKGGDQAAAKNLQQELRRVNGQCKQLAGMDFRTINPRFEANKTGKGDDELKTGDVNKEDSIQRDFRVQLEVMDKAGSRAADAKSNWKYTKQDDEFKMTNYDEKGNATGDRTVTVQQQLDSYNAQLDEAAKGYQEVASRLPTLQVPDLGKYRIEAGTKKMTEINQPTQAQMEEFGQNKNNNTITLPTNYNQVMNGKQ